MEDMEVKEIEGFPKYVINKVGNVYIKKTGQYKKPFSSEDVPVTTVESRDCITKILANATVSFAVSFTVPEIEYV